MSLKDRFNKLVSGFGGQEHQNSNAQESESDEQKVEKVKKSLDTPGFAHYLTQVKWLQGDPIRMVEDSFAEPPQYSPEILKAFEVFQKRDKVLNKVKMVFDSEIQRFVSINVGSVGGAADTQELLKQHLDSISLEQPPPNELDILDQQIDTMLTNQAEITKQETELKKMEKKFGDQEVVQARASFLEENNSVFFRYKPKLFFSKKDHAVNAIIEKQYKKKGENGNRRRMRSYLKQERERLQLLQTAEEARNKLHEDVKSLRQEILSANEPLKNLMQTIRERSTEILQAHIENGQSLQQLTKVQGMFDARNAGGSVFWENEQERVELQQEIDKAIFDRLTQEVSGALERVTANPATTRTDSVFRSLEPFFKNEKLGSQEKEQVQTMVFSVLNKAIAGANDDLKKIFLVAARGEFARRLGKTAYEAASADYQPAGTAFNIPVPPIIPPQNPSVAPHPNAFPATPPPQPSPVSAPAAPSLAATPPVSPSLSPKPPQVSNPVSQAVNPPSFSFQGVPSVIDSGINNQPLTDNPLASAATEALADEDLRIETNS